MELKKSSNLKIVSKIINKTLNIPSGLLCFGERSSTTTSSSIFRKTEDISHTHIHYDLLIISQTMVHDILQLQEKISRSLLNTSVNLLVHTEKEIEEAFANGNLFFLRIFQKANLEQLNSDFSSWSFASQLCRQNMSGIWRAHFQEAVSFHKAANKLLILKNNSAAFSMIIQSLEQACIGLLRACLDYQPKYTDLAYLIPFCDMLSNEFEHIIPRKTIRDRAYFQLLSKSKICSSHPSTLLNDPFTIVLLSKQCEEFLKIAGNVFESKNSA